MTKSTNRQVFPTGEVRVFEGPDMEPLPLNPDGSLQDDTRTRPPMVLTQITRAAADKRTANMISKTQDEVAAPYQTPPTPQTKPGT